MLWLEECNVYLLSIQHCTRIYQTVTISSDWIIMNQETIFIIDNALCFYNAQTSVWFRFPFVLIPNDGILFWWEFICLLNTSCLKKSKRCNKLWLTMLRQRSSSDFYCQASFRISRNSIFTFRYIIFTKIDIYQYLPINRYIYFDQIYGYE